MVYYATVNLEHLSFECDSFEDGIKDISALEKLLTWIASDANFVILIDQSLILYAYSGVFGKVQRSFQKEQSNILLDGLSDIIMVSLKWFKLKEIECCALVDHTGGGYFSLGNTWDEGERATGSRLSFEVDGVSACDDDVGRDGECSSKTDYFYSIVRAFPFSAQNSHVRFQHACSFARHKSCNYYKPRARGKRYSKMDHVACSIQYIYLQFLL